MTLVVWLVVEMMVTSPPAVAGLADEVSEVAVAAGWTSSGAVAHLASHVASPLYWR